MIKVVISDEQLSFYAEAKFNSMQEARVFVKCHPLARDPHTVRYLTIKEDVTPTKAEQLELERKRILTASDWLMLPDVKLDTKERKIYIQYRQTLRDLDFDKSDKIETFSHWLQRKYPEEFMDGGDSEKIIKKFNSYY